MLVVTGTTIVRKLAEKTGTPTFFSRDVLIENVQSYLFRFLLFSFIWISLLRTGSAILRVCPNKCRSIFILTSLVINDGHSIISFAGF